MAAALIISSNADFTSVMHEQIAHELGMECAVAANKAAAQAFLPTANIVISDDSREVANIAIPTIILTPPVRIAAVLRDIRTRLAGEEMAIGQYRFSPRSKQLSAGGQTVDLTDREAELLLALAKAGKTLIKDDLLKCVWGFEQDINTHTLETHIYRLRSKIRDVFGSEMIEAVDGGYRLSL